MQSKLVSFEKTKAFDIYQKAMDDLGHGKANTAAARALNHTYRKAKTHVQRVLVKQTSIKRGEVVSGLSFHRANKNNLEVRIDASGKELPLSKFGAKEFSYGVRAKVWGRFQTFKSAFVIGLYGGGVYTRVSSKRFPIKQMYGPSLAKELLKDDSAHTFYSYSFKLKSRFEHELSRMVP